MVWDDETPDGKLASQLLIIFKSVVESKKIDLAGSLMLKGDSYDLILGFQVADGPEIEKLINELMVTVEEGYKDNVKVELNAAVYKRVTFHKLNIDIPESENRSSQSFWAKTRLRNWQWPRKHFSRRGQVCSRFPQTGIDSCIKDDVEELNSMRLAFAMEPILDFSAHVGEGQIVRRDGGKVTQDETGWHYHQPGIE